MSEDRRQPATDESERVAPLHPSDPQEIAASFEDENGNGDPDPPPKMGRLWKRVDGVLRGDPDPPPKLGRKSGPAFAPVPEPQPEGAAFRGVLFQAFDIELSPQGDGAVKALLRSDAANFAPEISFQLPLSEEERESVDAYFLQEADRHDTNRLSESPARHEADPGETSIETLEGIGAKLSKALFADDVQLWFGMAMGSVQGAGQDEGSKGLRIRLVLDPVQHPQGLGEVAGLPWELLLDPLRHTFLNRSPFTPVVRRMTSKTPKKSMLVPPPWRILAVASDPAKLPILDLERELQNIQSAVRERPTIEVDVVWNPSLAELRAEIQRVRPHILHFMGHGRFDEEVGQGLLALTQSNGEAQPATGEALELADATRELCLVVLNTCYSGAIPDQPSHDIYDGVASSLVKAGVPAVVAMQYPISDKAAIDFSTGFYRAIAQGAAVETAVGMGRQAIQGADKSSGEWAIPVLYLAPDEGRIFDMNAAKNAQRHQRLGVWSQQPKDPGQRVIGWDILQAADDLLDLTSAFDGRAIRSHELWKQEVYPDLQQFFLHTVSGTLPVDIYFAAHTTVAFASGYILEAKSGLDVTIQQFSHQKGLQEFGTSGGGEVRLPTWDDIADVVLDQAPGDVAVAVGLTHDVLQDVRTFLDRERARLSDDGKAPDRSVSRIMVAGVQGGPGMNSVLNGAHALRLAQQLAARIRTRGVEEREGTLHLFMAAPNAFVFRLGQLARAFGAIQLYEYAFDTSKPGGYTPSLRLP